MKKLTVKPAEEDDQTGHTFAERAESYYQKRPQLLALLQDLYNGYTALSDRYIQTMAKNHPQRSPLSQISAVYHDYCDQEKGDGVTQQIDSGDDSCLSYQQPPIMLAINDTFDANAIVADLVIKNVEYNILLNEISSIEQRYRESSRKIELQKSLLEVLESERLILLNENASLGYRVMSLVEENKGLAAESMFMKRKARELARCVLKMRENHKVYMLNRKIENLQAQIYGLEKTNEEYYEQLVKRDQHIKEQKGSTGRKNVDDAIFDNCFEREKPSQKLKEGDSSCSGSIGQGSIGGKRSPRWWETLKKMDLVFCGIQGSCT